MHTSVREINLCSDTSYFLRVDWEGCNFSTGFQLLLTDGQDAWRGEVRGEVVCNEAEELEMPLERYIEDVEQAFTGRENSNTYNFTLTPNPPGHSSTLTYEKMQKDISFRLGSVLLKAVPEPAEAVRNLLIHSLQRGNNLQHHNQRLQEENERLRGEQQHITAELKRYVGGKEALEAELYSRFVLVLNEKKAKIRSLQQDVTKLEEMRSNDQRKKDSVKSGQTRGQDDGVEADDYGGSTDEDPVETQSTPASSLESPTPGPLDESLSDLTDVAPSRKRRFRHLRAPEAAVKRPNPETSQRKRNDSPAGSSKHQTPRLSADVAAASSAVEDLFEEF
ncbi:DNA repair protein XRCC4 [Haplochromis burtoni]|uniref:X-ray repair complementing defective repair in Chinese hamster cells 4 n=1 Tax=Haplochromis burtoni TaxID=8153 RepID=A0A3Q2V6L6_HAPBU|nr:DNA repair protein XRCC4 [Haplochromis burtoni]